MYLCILWLRLRLAIPVAGVDDSILGSIALEEGVAIVFGMCLNRINCSRQVGINSCGWGGPHVLGDSILKAGVKNKVRIYYIY